MIKNSKAVQYVVIPVVIATTFILSCYLVYSFGRKPQKQTTNPFIYSLESSTDSLESRIVNTISREIDRNYLDNSSNEEFKTAQYLEYLKKVEMSENDYKFIALRKSKAGISKLYTYLTTMENMEFIKGVDETPLSSLKDYYKPLKELLNELNGIYSADSLSYNEKIERMYECMLKKIKPGELTEGSLGIGHLVNGKLGDCNDISAAYFALFNYYGIKCYFKMGEEIKPNEVHAWIAVDVKDYTIDLDPTWYVRFVPLKVSGDEIENFYFKEGYMRRKNPIPN